MSAVSSFEPCRIFALAELSYRALFETLISIVIEWKFRLQFQKIVVKIRVLFYRRGKLRSKSVWDRVYENAEKHANNNSNGSESSRDSEDKK